MSRPVGSALAPHTLSSTGDCRPHGSTGLPHPSGITLVSCCSACAMDFQAFSCASSLQPFGSIWLLLPSGSALVLSRTAFVSVLRCRGSVLLSRSLMSPVLSALQLHLGLHQHGLSLGHSSPWRSLPILIKAPLSIVSAVGLHPGLSAGGSTLNPPACLSVLAPSSIFSTGDPAFGCSLFPAFMVSALASFSFHSPMDYCVLEHLETAPRGILSRVHRVLLHFCTPSSTHSRSPEFYLNSPVINLLCTQNSFFKFHLPRA